MKFKFIVSKKNRGNGLARKELINSASNELIAIMDADDKCYPNRFELQLEEFLANPNLSVCGGFIDEFENGTNRIIGIREVPKEHEDILKFIRFRSPVNHVTAMMRKKEVEAVGSYENLRHAEDYCLWIKLASKGAIFKNINRSLVAVRVDENQLKRRSGFNTFKMDVYIQRKLLFEGYTNIIVFVFNVTIRLLFDVFANGNIKKLIYKILRNKKCDEEYINLDNKVIAQKSKLPFSVIMSVYEKDRVAYVIEALESVVNQTSLPDEIVVLADGPISDMLKKAIIDFGIKFDFNLIEKD